MLPRHVILVVVRHNVIVNVRYSKHVCALSAALTHAPLLCTLCDENRREEEPSLVGVIE